MPRTVSESDLDAMSDDELNDLLERVMVKLRQRDTQELKRNLMTESQRLSLDDILARQAGKH